MVLTDSIKNANITIALTSVSQRHRLNLYSELQISDLQRILSTCDNDGMEGREEEEGITLKRKLDCMC